MSIKYDWIQILGIDYRNNPQEALEFLDHLKAKHKTLSAMAKVLNVKPCNVQYIYYTLRRGKQTRKIRELVTLKANPLGDMLKVFYPRLYKYAKSEGYSDSEISMLIAEEKEQTETHSHYLDMTRATKPNFIRYMLDRKAYFEDLTGIRATKENVELYFDWLKSKNLVARAYQEEPFRRNRRVA